ncbi:MAG: hypothetical protein K6F04_03420 [bacterium]|nr:hypothetical protein [bacterium]
MGTTAAVIGGVVSAAKTVMDIQDAKKSKKLAKKEAKIQEDNLRKKQELYEEEKRNLLKSKVASKKAKMASNGVDFTDGSSAVLLGSMEREAEDEIKNKEYFSDLALASNDINYNYKKNKNLLTMRKKSLDLLDSFGDLNIV